ELAARAIAIGDRGIYLADDSGRIETIEFGAISDPVLTLRRAAAGETAGLELLDAKGHIKFVIDGLSPDEAIAVQHAILAGRTPRSSYGRRARPATGCLAPIGDTMARPPGDSPTTEIQDMIGKLRGIVDETG